MGKSRFWRHLSPYHYGHAQTALHEVTWYAHFISEITEHPHTETPKYIIPASKKGIPFANKKMYRFLLSAVFCFCLNIQSNYLWVRKGQN